MLFENHPDAPDFLELAKQDESKDTVQFPLYEDTDLKFLDQNTEIGRQIGKSIVAADFDDDCCTDEDMHTNA